MKNILLLPAVIFFLLFTLWPLGEVIYLSLLKTNFITTSFIGFQNYIDLFSDTVFIQSFFNSIFYALLLVPGQIILSLVVSLSIYNLSKKWQDISRIIFYIPVLAGGIILASIWKWIFHVDGLINYLLGFLSIGKVFFFSQGITAIPVISFIVIITSFGSYVIIVIANILSIDKTIFEAAKIDGANQIQIDLFIIIPMIKKTIQLIGLLSIIAAFQIFENIYALCPQSYAATMTYEIYRTSFKNSKYGLASAMSIVLLIIILIISLIKRSIERENESV
jgi:multiple sugar transport system permease protein